ncbi:hypothetical protein MICCA_1180005 [Microcystis aeruginosa PCC 9432]|jgi:hypothetical protein|uniref:Uncharacterized protein n=2 Tax=Microcystis aeruginosa TaxID=1126 RepID=A0A822L8A5_MICAE|nr:hypothetical protein [Microcystis aeruginosa]MBE9247268.1 hypothetical protein [Microcystis aeruginosa LEGE 00239]MDB9397970.1 hypothetical protein [Microcystis aeruginosa CS-573]GCE61947.1 hypothetical protein MiAbB_03891 [Microcystis aeruginosa NIES-4285]CCH91213.1 hypothetical protein MICCA_1180005 [Microcystis aeruginosa PCC 9432]
MLRPYFFSKPYLVDNIFQPQPEMLEIEDCEIISEFFLDFMVTVYEKE